MGKKAKSKSLQIVEWLAFYGVIALARPMPVRVVRGVCAILGRVFYLVAPRRRKIALDNIRMAFGDRMGEKEIKRLAQQSCKAFLLTAAEMIKSPFRVKDGKVIAGSRYKSGHIEHLFRKAKAIHDQSGGCIFVTPHLGNWELLPHLSAQIGIPLAVVIRPLDNPYLERALLSSRIGSGHLMVPKANAMFHLDRVLRKGVSVAMLPDQSHNKGLRVDFFGKPATVTPLPALLAVRHKRPVVVVAACRTEDPYYFEGFVSDPIRPDPQKADDASEIVRITREINARMEEIITRFPEQYLWMHDRWKKSWRKPVFDRAVKSEQKKTS
ncbi:MAG: lysophospholipid acyltransferase family protein [Syntrophobacteraceae bacterium]|nr:lysophospholipid acyltransferase family protein [Syntrophobacteraceae bacterium]